MGPGREQAGFQDARETQLLDVVALMNDQPDQRLTRGPVGTIVEALDQEVFQM